MGAYNAINGIPACANTWLLDDVLREEWGFQGYVVSDCGAISDIVHGHRYETDPEKAVSMAVKAGTDLECETCETEQFMYDKYLLNAVQKGYLSDKDIDKAVTRLFRARFLLGEFDPPAMVPYNQIPESRLDCKDHRELALQAARESIVLLKNKDKILPLSKDETQSLAVIGPFADEIELGGYSGTPSFAVSTYEGLKNLIGAHKVHYEKGCDLVGELDGGYERAVSLAASSEIAVVVVGTNLDLANEGNDLDDLSLPAVQRNLVKQVYQANPRTIVVLVNGTPLAINWINDNIPAIVETWYGGQSAGTAIVEVLFGGYNPGGRLPVTFYKSVSQLPPFDDYDITAGRTYWYFTGDPLYPFGHGLSYTQYSYSNLTLSAAEVDLGQNETITVNIDVMNTGEYDGDEVVQLYVVDMESLFIQPLKKLRAFKRIHLKQGGQERVTFELDRDDFVFWNEEHQDWSIEEGVFELQLGSSSTDIRLNEQIEVSFSGDQR